LASAQRLWVRGQIQTDVPPSHELQPPPKKRWWKRWNIDSLRNGHAQSSSFPEKIRLETSIRGAMWDTEVSLARDGRFDALLAVDFPKDRQSWQVARYRACAGGQSAEAGGVVISPTTVGGKAIVVILPFEYTFNSPGINKLADPKWAPHVTEILRATHPSSVLPNVFYLGCISTKGGSSAAELALAATALNWPSGEFVLVPAERSEEHEAFAQAVDRVRWLFADSLELELLNLEPTVNHAISTWIAPKADRAVIGVLRNSEEGRIGAHQPRLSYNRIINVQPSRAGLIPRHPLVFCHGMLAFSMLKMQIPENWNCFSPLREILRSRGIPVLFPQVPPTSGVRERAEELRTQVLRWTTEPVNLIAHSMGGLDARFMISSLGMGDQVASLTTVSTPHRGSYLADWFLANYRQRVPLLLALEAFGFNVDGFKDCRPAVCRKFNEQNPDHPKVRYFSYGGDVPQSRLSPFLRRAWNVLTPVEGPNDGMVSVASARWGEYLGSIHSDHFAQTPDATFLREGEDFDSLGFFANLVEELAHRGF
jgi:triacylglycerol lipase